MDILTKPCLFILIIGNLTGHVTPFCLINTDQGGPFGGKMVTQFRCPGVVPGNESGAAKVNFKKQ